ncbi:MAG TPA: hypothetical protein V6C71_10000 [Coleofasciculaceae cyanobacterium]
MSRIILLLLIIAYEVRDVIHEWRESAIARIDNLHPISSILSPMASAQQTTRTSYALKD